MVNGLKAKTEADEAPRSVEFRREAYTMALYVAVCLLAALAASPETHGTHRHALQIIWGVTLGLAVAHWFAFQLSTRLVRAGRLGRADVELAAAQMLGAVAVAALASIPVIALPESFEFEAAGLVLAAFLAAVGFVAMRSRGATRATGLLYALGLLVAAATIVELKNRLAGH